MKYLEKIYQNYADVTLEPVAAAILTLAEVIDSGVKVSLGEAFEIEKGMGLTSEVRPKP